MQVELKNTKELEKYILDNHINNTLIVCGHSFYKNNLYNDLNKIYDNNGIKKVFFDEFTPNPKYEEVITGLEVFNSNQCDSIISIGGGSAIDVAKCIKLYSEKNDVKFITVPTTAGTGSEATKLAVIYKEGKKVSVEDKSLIPNAIYFDNSFLKTLPDYQKKATVLDTFSHAIESMWSINSNKESLNYSKKAIELIINNIDQYLLNKEESFENMFKAANYAGKAINITKTTAGHAMCYKLTSLYGISHGHAAMLVNSELLPFMIDHIENCVDKRGKEYLINIFNQIQTLVKNDVKEYFRYLLVNLDLYNVNVNLNDLDLLVESVNVERLSNNPVKLEKEDIKEIYTRLFNRIEERKNESNRFC